MIKTGQYNDLTILRQASVGLFLGDDLGKEVLLPNKYCSEEMKPGVMIRVFVYRDSEDRIVATTLTPKIHLNEFAFLKVTAVSEVGAFLDWGLEKELMVPFREQRQKMEPGRWYIVYMVLDQKTDRLFASNKVEKYLHNDQITVKEGDEVSLIVLQKTDLGYSVIVNHLHKGLVFENEIFKELHVGNRLHGFVKKIRPDHKIDISLQPIGFLHANDAYSEMIIKNLLENDGYLGISDKSTPDEIYAVLGISKKAFKKSIGTLYRQRRITIEPDGIKLQKDVSD